jgi:hypothetical protein
MIFAAIAVGLITAFQQFQQMEAARKKQEYEADVASSNAVAMRQQAELTKRKVEADRVAADKEKHKTKRAYMEAAGTNMANMSAANLDISSGSALSLLEGNAAMYADDMGELEEQKNLDTFMGKRQIANEVWRADLFDNNASYLEKTAGSTSNSLLMSGASGVASGLGTYMGGGGKFGSGATATKPSKAFSSTANYSKVA